MSKTNSTVLSSLSLGLDQPQFWSRNDQFIFHQDNSVPHAPKRVHNLSSADRKLAISNALRYFESKHHARLSKEFLKELDMFGHIYMYRFRPTEYEMKAYPINDYPGKSIQARGIMVMIMNNLDTSVAQHPHELITYGGNGSVFSNWAQYLLVMKYLSTMTDEQTLVMYSGHPLGLFPSHPDAPRVVVTNGMMIPNYSTREIYDKLYAQGVTQYGQMTAGSYCYIGPQGIVHGTTLVCLNAGRKYTSSSDLRGKLFVTAGLGGMSGAQPKAGYICKLIAVVSEVDEAALNKRLNQGWITEKCTDLDKLIQRIKQARKEKVPVSIGFLGNVVDVWERLAKDSINDPDLVPELGSDQTSLHNPYQGGYYPVDVPFSEAKQLISDNPDKFKDLVHESLRRHVAAINILTKRGMEFFDYGNAFLLESGRAGADIFKEDDSGDFKYPSYVQSIMGDIFSLGFGPFRWVCTSGLASDLAETDRIAKQVLVEQLNESKSHPNPALGKLIEAQISDNILWISECDAHKLVVGSQARILYANAEGRSRLAYAINSAIAKGQVSGPVMLSRDHHDVSGTDSPFRETANVTDGSAFCADMAVQNAIGCGFRGATSISLHNGGGVGWGEVMNGGFLLLLDGSEDAARRAKHMLFWDVNNGIARRAWSGNDNAVNQVADIEANEPMFEFTRPHLVDPSILDSIIDVSTF